MKSALTLTGLLLAFITGDLTLAETNFEKALVVEVEEPTPLFAQADIGSAKYEVKPGERLALSRFANGNFLQAALISQTDDIQLIGYVDKTKSHSNPNRSSASRHDECPRGQIARPAGTMGGMVCVPKNVVWPLVGCPGNPWKLFCD